MNALSSVRYSLISMLGASLALAACASSSSTMTSDITPQTSASAPPPGASVSVADRDLTPDEKKIIMSAISTALSNPASAKYHWTKFPTVPESNEPAYCGTVDGQSPYGAYSGHQAYIVDTKVTGGHITAAALGLVTGGKDFKLVVDKCAEHGLDPRKAT